MDLGTHTLPNISIDGSQIPTPHATNNDAAARKAAENFESFFLSQIIGSMFTGLKTDGMFGGGPGEAIYRSMMGEEFGRAAARSGGIGIADAVYREIVKLQEVKAP